MKKGADPLRKKKPPDLKALVEILNRHGLRYVVTDSVAALLYGIQLQPGDFDITPALDARNLRGLIDILMEIKAVPESLGHWETQATGEKKWVEEETSPEVLANWKPDLENIDTFDHLFYTRYGDFDIVPEMAGEYEVLRKGAVRKMAFGYPLWVAHIDELLAKLTVPRRPKDESRVRELRRIQRRLKLP
ncbi:MAG: hypothetical protein PVG14_13300 [Anaerolineales bacterium]|jgi:hypothetical protein